MTLYRGGISAPNTTTTHHSIVLFTTYYTIQTYSKLGYSTITLGNETLTYHEFSYHDWVSIFDWNSKDNNPVRKVAAATLTADLRHLNTWRETSPHYNTNITIFLNYIFNKAPKVLLHWFLANTLHIQCHVSIFHWIKLFYATKITILYFTSPHWTSIVPTSR